MNQEHEIVATIYAAKENSDMADSLIRHYLPFIKSETAKFIKRPPIEGHDDELSIAMFAFHESILHYNRLRGNFLKFAANNIRNRLIDYYRKEQRHVGLISLHNTIDSDEERTLMDTLANEKNEISELHDISATKAEIVEFSQQLQTFQLSLEDIADNCPKQKRTLSACHKALAYAKANPELLDTLLSTGKLPISQLAAGSGVERKTLERHRKYMVAILLAYTNGFEIIRGHLHQVAPQKGERRL